MLRLFSGLELPQAVRGSLARLQCGVERARWSAAENMHITLCFIGEVEEPVAQAVDEALGRIRRPAFHISCAGVGTFGTRPVRSLWCGVGESEALTALQRANVAALRAAGLDLGRRRYRPHVTLARTRGAAHRQTGRWLAAHGLFRSEGFRVGHFSLFSSHLGQAGATYRVERRYPLQEAPPSAA